MVAESDDHTPTHRRNMLLGSTAVGGMTNWRRGTSIRMEEREFHSMNERIRTFAGRGVQ
jgi:hypothetical protein